MLHKILLRSGPASGLSALDIGEPAFTTDTKGLYIGTSMGNAQILGFTGLVGCIIEDISSQIIVGDETHFDISTACGSVIVMLNGLMQSIPVLDENGLGITIDFTVELTDSLIVVGLTIA